MAKRFWDQVYADASPPEPAPGPSEVVKLLSADFENNALQSRPTHVDDFRGPVPSRPPAREYMQVQRLRDMGLG
jgi:hypothetical protein